MDIEHESMEACVHRYAVTCELIFGQPESYYRELLRRKTIEPVDFGGYHLLITGLHRKVYRPFFGIDAFDYTACFRETEREIHALLRTQGVQCVTAMLLYDHSKRLCMLFNTPAQITAMDVAQIVAGCFNRMYARIFDMAKTPYRNYTVLSDPVGGYERLTAAFERLDALSRQQFFDMQTMIMTPGMFEGQRTAPDREQIHEDLMQLRFALREKDAQEAMHSLDTLMKQLGRSRDFDLLQDVLRSIRVTLAGVLQSHGLSLDDVEMEGRLRAESYATFGQLHQTLERCLIRCMDLLKGAPSMSAPVQEAVRYIRHHYAESISLSDIAAYVGMSPSWLSRHFSDECACSIPAYLLSVRIERACALLKQTDMHVFEVAHAVGMANPRYFTSVFRRATGMAPKAYRGEAREREDETARG